MDENNIDLDENQQKTLIEAIEANPSYNLAFRDTDLLLKDELRPVRLQLEFLKPEMYLQLHNVKSTIVVFGSTRIPSPDITQRRLKKLIQQLEAEPDKLELKKAVDRAQKQVARSRYYQEARRFAQIVTKRYQKENHGNFVVMTGGGPGIMEAANRGAHDVNGPSIGLNIVLPHEQFPNPFITPGLCFQFHYFALRKMHFMLRAKALVAFPGGYGTMDELFEALTLIQTRKVARIPIVLVGKPFWEKVIDFDFLLEEEVINADDIKLFTIVDTADEAFNALHHFYQVIP